MWHSRLRVYIKTIFFLVSGVLIGCHNEQRRMHVDSSYIVRLHPKTATYGRIIIITGISVRKAKNVLQSSCIANGESCLACVVVSSSTVWKLHIQNSIQTGILVCGRYLWYNDYHFSLMCNSTRHLHDSTFAINQYFDFNTCTYLMDVE
jgi:hypothetical protein